MKTENKSEERQVVCSSCLNIFPEALIHVIPHFNGDAGGYVTTYRCEQCWLPSLDETQARLASTEDWAEIASVCAFFESHGVFLHEFKRGDPFPVVRELTCRTIDLLRSGALRLSIGPLMQAPAKADEDMDALISESERYEQLGEAAYEAMYEAKSYLVKDLYDDARSCFAKAIDAAKRAGLEHEVARLTRRRDDIVSVYNRQFRGVGR